MKNRPPVAWLFAALLAVLLVLSLLVLAGRSAETPSSIRETRGDRPPPSRTGIAPPAIAPAIAPVSPEGVEVEQREEPDAALPSDPRPGEASVWPANGEGVSGAVREAVPRMKRCYEAELARDPTLEGQITARFEIEAVDGVGRVTGLDLETTTEHDALDACITDVMAELVFDAPTEGVTVTYPLVFSRAP